MDYIGCSKEINFRLEQHSLGKTKSTKPYRPWKVIYTEQY
ncbi:GIY-YIG nuclease family protein [Patescibacteria group bacterium]